MEIGFECLDGGKWYVILPEYEGEQEDLEMVDNADNFLEALTEDGLYVYLDVNMEAPNVGDFFILEMEAHDDDGAFYNVIDCDRFSGTIWLCNVVHAVYGEHPQTLYCSVIDQ